MKPFGNFYKKQMIFLLTNRLEFAILYSLIRERKLQPRKENRMEKKDVKEIESLIKAIGGTSFVGITYRNQKGELSRYVVNVGINHRKVLEKDLARLPKIKERLFHGMSTEFGEDIAAKAFAEKEASIRASLEGTNVRANAQKEAYVIINNGMKFGIDTKRLYIYAYKVFKVILEEGTYPTVNSRKLTLAKAKIDKYMKARNYRQFIIESDQLEKMVTGGKIIEIAA